MKKLCLLMSLFVIPAMTQTKSIPGVFYVSNYSANGTHTDYDMARQAADAYANTQYSAGSVLVLKSGINLTCDAIVLPSNGTFATTSIIGMGSSVSTLQKSVGCTATAATLRHSDSPNGTLSRGWFQGFTVDANHIDSAACEIYGMSLTTFVDVACGNAAANADHELEFGNRDANLVGWMDNIYMYGLSSFDSAPTGAGGILAPVWTNGQLTSVTVTNPGTSAYSSYVRAQIVGPALTSCTTVPTLKPLLDGNGLVTGATITAAGSCRTTTGLAIVIQDGTPVSYALKFTNVADSHVWNIFAANTATYGDSWLLGSNDNSIVNEQTGPNQLMALYDNGNGNRHINPLFNSPAQYGANIWGQNGTIRNAVFQYQDQSYVAASGYFLGNNATVYQDWMISNSTCTNNATANFFAMTDKAGIVNTTNVVPNGAKPQSIEACDGTGTVHWPVYSGSGAMSQMRMARVVR